MRRLRWLCLLGSVALGLGVFAIVQLVSSLPDLRALEHYRPALPTRVLDRHGEQIGEFAQIRRRLVRLSEIPQPVIASFLAAEDAGFYQHHGLDLAALARAAWVNLQAGGVRQGGSTITQQLAKSLLASERTVDRKLRDMALALRIEARLTKDRILEIYLNEIYLGNGAYGVAQAARSYFDKELSGLTLSEAALLAGLTKAPSAYSPTVNPEAAETRRLHVLDRLRELGWVDEARWRTARAERPPLRSPALPEAHAAAAWFVEEVRRSLIERLGPPTLLRDGLVVETTLDLDLQREAVSALREGTASIERRRARRGGDRASAPLEGALVALDVASGDVLALVGGTDFARSQFNRATQARRQPGSAFKPFVYGAALEAGWRPDATVYDVQVQLRDPGSGRRWTPRNAGGVLRGAVPIYEALARSLNNATVRLLIEVGVDRVVQFARRSGIRSSLAEDLGLALGSSGVTPLELTSAYRTFAAGGRERSPRMIRRVLDRDGAVVIEDTTPSQAALSPVDAYLVTHLLRGPVRHPYGTAYAAAALKRPLAGKTGSTNDNRDAWFVGYSPDLVAGVWIGHDQMEPLGPNGTGSRMALPIWIDFMEAALAGREARDPDAAGSFPIPDGVEWTWRDRETGEMQRSRRAIAGFVPSAAGRAARRSKVVAIPRRPEPKPSEPALAAAIGSTAALSVPLAPLPAQSPTWPPPVGAGPP